MNRILATAIVGLLALPAYAEGDAEAGKKTFNKCKSCHMIADPAGEVIVKGGKTGPNLYGIAGRTAGTVEGFKYGDSIVAAGEKGLVWDETTFVEYAQDPKAFLKTYLDDTSAKSKMTFKLKKGAEDVYAYIASVSGE
ncbi:cytochrome C [Ruegeria sp. HKCCD6228]|jgi:cytochrome c|uniref:Cytochrome C n=1 Tax=Ruegeria atlantica TaxID=81569 RepID=A0AA91C065_9RHOB|nr:MULTISPECIES: c-type cytochrome [Ruegeria]NOC92017.1 cytochrome C [Ruegeria sp. HKCCD6604]NOD30564.1 cytochrome C [Ruegeria atlantica]NOD96768.1 cytochrome C [Ruegeria sp. HKCCD6228]NOE19031.1 cytochrome C [Ruegeria atlantica]NOE26658.1 cytochrome C [Ruegeria sp. HKCCD6157]